MLGDQDRISVGMRSGTRRSVPTRGHDPVKRRAVDAKIPDNRKGFGPKRFDRNCIAVLETAHMQLAGRRRCIGSMRPAIDYDPAHPANSLTAIAVKFDRSIIVENQILVEKISISRKTYRTHVIQVVGGSGFFWAVCHKL